MTDFFVKAQFDQLYDFFASGNPPLALQLLIVNTIFMIVMFIRRMRGSPALRGDSYMILQGLLITANVAIIFRSQIEGFLHIAV